jgi:hypothetical protein
MDMETFLGATLIVAWAAVVLRGLERTALAARKGRKWERAYLSRPALILPALMLRRMEVFDIPTAFAACPRV